MKRKSKKLWVIVGAVLGVIGVTLGITFGTMAALGAKQPADYRENLPLRFIAHRGLSSQYAENTEAAFLAAAKSPFFYGIETDVYFTTDDVAVCAHDDNAFQDGSVRITESIYAEIENLPLKESSYGFSGSEICTFVAYLSICRQYDKVAVIELKQPSIDSEQIKTLIKLAKYYCDDRFVLISFSSQQVKMAEQTDASVVTQHLSGNSSTGRMSLLQGYNVSLSKGAVNAALIRSAHRKGREVGVWTVNTIEEISRLAALGVDYVTGLTKEEAARLASSFGGGLGRQRELCGAVVAMSMIAGWRKGYAAPGDDTVKGAHYALIQQLSDRFRQKFGSIICRDLLGEAGKDDSPVPSARTAEYYRARSCADFVAYAAELADAIQ